MKIEYTVTGKTVEEAYQKAVELYSAYGEIAMEEIISRGKKGFLGIFGAVPAEIKISVDDGKEERKPQKSQKPQKQSQHWCLLVLNAKCPKICILSFPSVVLAP